MNPGILNRKLQIQRQASGLYMVTATGVFMVTASGKRMMTSNRKGRFGAELDAWGLWKTRMGRRVESKGIEQTNNGRESNSGLVVFRIRFTRGLKTTDRLVDLRDGQVYDIIDFLGEEREGWLEIYCTRHRTPENTNGEL